MHTLVLMVGVALLCKTYHGTVRERCDVTCDMRHLPRSTRAAKPDLEGSVWLVKSTQIILLRIWIRIRISYVRQCCWRAKVQSGIEQSSLDTTVYRRTTRMST